jgi:hypothetical protein
MPTTIEELEAAIQDTTSQANSILFVNSNILEQYEIRQRQVYFNIVIFVGLFHVPSIFIIYCDFTDRRSCNKTGCRQEGIEKVTS